MNALRYERNVTLGCDPEFFFTGKKGETTGAEKVLPEEGLTYKPGTAPYDGSYTAKGDRSKIVIDGVQAELNPRPNPCRANLGNEIGACFRDLAKVIEKSGVKVNFAPVVSITQKELDSLSEKSKVFGCAPSTNVYASKAESKIKVDPKKYLKRSAGGHIHLGSEGNPQVTAALKNPDVLVPILDIVVGNTCVLLDRNPNNKERRVNYGRAGEHRVKEYGLEYRTLSNFWLQSYQLMSLVMGLARLAVHIVAQSTETNNIVAALTEAVKREDIIKAINENDFVLAYINFLKIEKILITLTGGYDYDYPFTKNNIQLFHWFVKKGVNYWFKEDPFSHWIAIPEGHGTGWETFLHNTVKMDLEKAKISIESMKKKMETIRDMNKDTAKKLKACIIALKNLEPSNEPAKKDVVEAKPVVAPK